MSDLHFACRGNRVLLVRHGDDLVLPDAEEVATALGGEKDRLTPVSVAVRPVDNKPCHVYELPDGYDPAPGGELVGLRALHPLVSDPVFRAAGTAVQKLEWLQSQVFCSRCATPTRAHPTEEARLCPACGLTTYPRIAPAVIVLIERDDEMLLARSPHFPEGVYSTVAGFVEPGEALEDTVRREILEEVGVEVGEVRYFGSQPWPFPHSLMVGFVASWASGEIRIDGVEIEHAAWFAAHRLPPRMPTSFSIARALIDDFLGRFAAGS